MHTDLPPTGHPLADTVARLAWLIPVLPLLGFLVNGLLSLRAAPTAGPADPSAAGHHHGDHGAHGEAHHDHGSDDGHHAARHPAAELVSLVGPGVLLAAFGLTLAVFFAMRGAGEGIVRWTLAGEGEGDLDGLPTTWVPDGGGSADEAPATEHAST